jgi:hypothetical protein
MIDERARRTLEFAERKKKEKKKHGVLLNTWQGTLFFAVLYPTRILCI